MRKLKLSLETLRVETFEAERVPRARGTVHGRFMSAPIGCQNQCGGVIVTEAGCATDRCSAAECNSLSGCATYEVANCGLN